MTENQQLGARIPRKLYEQVQKLAAAEGVSLNHLIVEAIRDLLRKYEKAATRRGGRTHG